MLKYIGKSFIIGIPARDLTDEEARKFGVKRLVATGLYKEVRKTKLKETVKQAVEDTAEVTKWQG